MGSAPSSVLSNTEVGALRSNNSHGEPSGSACHRERNGDEVPTVHLRRAVVQPSRTSSDSSPADHGVESEPSYFATGGVVPLVQVSTELGMASHNESAGEGTYFTFGGAAEASGSTSIRQRRNRDRQSLIRFEQYHQAHRSTPVASISLPHPWIEATPVAAAVPVGQHTQPHHARPLLSITVAHPPSLGGSVGDIYLTVGGNEPQRPADHNGRHFGEGSHNLLQSQQSLLGDGSTSAAWCMDDMSRPAVSAKEATSMATEDEEALLWYDDDREFGSSIGAPADN